MIRIRFQTALPVTALMVAAVLLSGCDSARKAVGLEKDAPDEFAVYSRAPLSLPPDYALTPPDPGVVRPQEGDTRSQAKSALLTGAEASSPAPQATSAPVQAGSPGLQALLREAGADNADPSIRQLVNSETRTLTADESKLTDAILFWAKPDEFGTVVDPAKEAKRIQENQALGRPINEGDVPIIERKSDKFLFTW